MARPNRTASGMTQAEFRHGHGKKNTPAYRSWKAMRTRCFNTNAADYPRYGGKGITVCERWDSFRSFLADMGERPDGYTLERVDNDENYEPANCKWASRKEQARNRSHNRIIEYQGERKTVSEWAEANGLTLATLRARLSNGWALAIALSRPLQQNAKLTPDKVRAIRVSCQSPERLAVQYGVHRTVIFSVRSRRTWKHIQ